MSQSEQQVQFLPEGVYESIERAKSAMRGVNEKHPEMWKLAKRIDTGKATPEEQESFAQWIGRCMRDLNEAENPGDHRADEEVANKPASTQQGMSLIRPKPCPRRGHL